SKAESQVADALRKTIVFGVSVTSSPNGSPGLVPGGGAGWLGAGVGGAWAMDCPAPATMSATTTKAAGNDLPRQNIGFSWPTPRQAGFIATRAQAPACGMLACPKAFTPARTAAWLINVSWGVGW